MESRNGGVSSKGFLIPVPDSADLLENSVLAPLQSAYLYEESKHFFRYDSAFLVQNPALEEKYNNFRASRREAGYTEEELKESYGFLLFDDVNKANTLAETGVPTGNSACTTLGDPTKGIYISMYSDCLDLNRWCIGRSGYIAIIRLTKGKVNKVLENYTQNFTEPTVGFDCHVSEQLHSVSSQTSSFLAFERTQYYMYELLDDGSKKTAPSPSAACPLAIVSFSYTDTRATLVTQQEEKSELKKIACPYLPWRGKLQFGSQFYHFGLRSTSGAFIPAELPPVVKVDKVISMVDLRHLLPKAVFETCFTGEAYLDGLYWSLCELISSEVKESGSIALLLEDIKEKDVAFTIPLNDGGFLILLHLSHFLAYDDFGIDASEVLQGIFVFSHSRVAVRDTKGGQSHPPTSSEILRCLPALSYAEGEVEKSSIDTRDKLCDVVAQHMQSYAALINPGLESFPSRDVSVFPDQYDVPSDHKHLYLSPEWNSMAWQSMRSYLNKPASFQLPLSKASDVLVAGQEEQREDLDDDDVYICQSPPEIGSPVSKLLDNQLPDKTCAANLEMSLDCGVSGSKAQADSLPEQENVGLALQAGCAATDGEQCAALTGKSESNDMEAKKLLPTSDDLPTELIVSITSAEQSASVDTLSVDRNVSAKPNNLEFNEFLNTTKVLQTESCSDEPDKSGQGIKSSIPPKASEGTLQRSPSEGQMPGPAACVETTSSHTCRTPEVDGSRTSNDENPKDLSGYSNLKTLSNTSWRKASRLKCKLGNLSIESNEERPAAEDSASVKEKSSDSGWQSLRSSILKELEAHPLIKKTERWDLKPVISECGRFLVPHGSVDIANRIISIKKKIQATKGERYAEKVKTDASAEADDAEEKEQEAASVDGRDHQHICDSHPDQKILERLDDDVISVPLNIEGDLHLVKNDDTDSPPSRTLQGKQTDTISTVKLSRGESLLCKLKSVLLRGKRKHFLSTEELTETTVQDKGPTLKKDRVDSESETFKGNPITTLVTGTAVKDVSSMMPVDLFAYALGLTPKETHVKLRRSENQERVQREASAETQKQTCADKQPQILLRPPPISPRRGRIKTLKKHQGISEECIKKKWWLHFQSPACNAIEKRKYKDCTRDKSVRKTVKEKVDNTCSSTDGLNLLADLALSANSGQVPSQSNPALERKPETSLKEGDFTKHFTKADQESLLHALLRQPAARATQPPECHSPSNQVGSSELLDLMSKEHAYSLPPSSSLLLGLPGTPFPVSPVSDSTRLLLHQQTMNDDRIKTLHPSVGQEDRHERCGSPEYVKKHKMLRQKFRHSRTFGYNEKSIRVTRQWQENYNFDLDSKFTSEMKSKTINRALHGPWDFAIQDTNEEVRLIIHTWIGLFYSRSTARLFHLESNLTCPCPEESNSLQSPCGGAPGPAETELKGSSNAQTSEPSNPTALDLSKKRNLESGTDAVVLDLSLKNSNPETGTLDPHMSRKESPVLNEQEDASEILCEGELHEASTHQSHRKAGLSSEHSEPSLKSQGKDVKNIHEKESGTQSAVFVSEMSFEGDQTAIDPQDLQSAEISARDQMLNECNKEDSGKSENAEDQLVKKPEVDLSKFVADAEKHFNQKASDEQHKMGVKDDKSSEIKQDPSQEVMVGPSGKGIHTVQDSPSEQLDVICSSLENQMPCQRKEPESNLPDLTETIRDVDSCRHEVEAIESYNHSAENLPDKNSSCISAMEDDEPVPANTDDIVFTKGEYTEECATCEKMDEQLHQAENSTAGHHELPTNTACPNDIALTDESVASEMALQTPSEMLPMNDEVSAENNSEKDPSLTDNADVKMVLLPLHDETCSTAELNTDLSMPQTKSNAVMEIQKKVESDFTFDLNGSEHEHQQTKSADGINNNKSRSWVLIPFLEMDIPGDDETQPQDSSLQHKAKDIVQDQEEMPIITKSADAKAFQANQAHGTAQFCSEKAEPSSPKLPLCAKKEAYQPADSGTESDNRCPTPTIDEKPFGYTTSSSDGSFSPFSDGKICKDITQTYSSPPNEIPKEQKLCNTSAVRSICSSGKGSPDLEMRTLRVLESVKNLLSKSSHNDKPNKIMDGDIGKEKPAVSCATQDLQTDSSAQFSSFKDRLEHIIGVKLQVKKADSLPPQHYPERNGKWEHTEENITNSCKSVPSPACLKARKPKADQRAHQRKSQSHESHSYCQRPVMAVKPSKSDESQVDGLSEDPYMNNKLTSAPEFMYTMSPSVALEKTMEEHVTVNSKKVKDSLKACELTSIDTWLMNYRSNLDRAEIDILEPAYEYQRSNQTSSSSVPVQSLESAKSWSDHLKGGQGFLRCDPVEEVEEGKDETIHMDRAECSYSSVSFVTRKENGDIDDALMLTPQTSLACTISNDSRKRPITFLEQLSNQCVQADLTQASIEQECLIFLDKMKRLVKKSKKGPMCQQESFDNLRSSSTSPLTVHFSRLEEQDDPLDLLDTSLIGQKIKVDMSNRKTSGNSAKEKNCYPKESSKRSSNPVEYSLVSDVTTECTRLFEAAMDDVCAVKKVPSRPKKFKMDQSHPKAGPSNHFDFCGQMKREMDEMFRSTLNSVVKKSCKTKYRFFILWTSDDVFFEETKAQLEAEGHTAVNPSEFFIEERLSSLLIILRNEDIAEHICQIPRLLELKKSSNVLFAGIDEPDDIINLTHQELFSRGGFIVIDKAALEPLSLCNMRKISEILQELSKKGKWKWMLHYRDSRRLKENARLSAEAKEKKHLLHCGEEAGILEVLPYHECDLMSRDQPDYLPCLVHLQIQNISSRYAVFITETKTRGTYERNGILTMTMNSFLTKALSDFLTV